MQRQARTRLGVLIVCASIAGGCAAVERGLTGIDYAFERASNATSYASWQHLGFSVKVSAQRTFHREGFATARDVETAARQGGWWGEEVPVAPGR